MSCGVELPRTIRCTKRKERSVNSVVCVSAALDIESSTEPCMLDSEGSPQDIRAYARFLRCPHLTEAQWVCVVSPHMGRSAPFSSRLPPRTECHPQQDTEKIVGCWLSSVQCLPLPISHPVGQVPLRAILSKTRTKLWAAGFRLSSACPCPSATQSARCLSNAKFQESLTTFAFSVVGFSFFHMGPFCPLWPPFSFCRVGLPPPPHCVFLMGTRARNAHADGNGSTDHPNSFLTF